MANLVGSTVGKYRVVARMGRGGMAEVYKAYQPGLKRYVALKTLHSHLVEDQDLIKKFEREARAVASLRHPNIVAAYDFGHEGETFYLATEFIDGPTLKNELKARSVADKPLTFREIALIVASLCSAIDHAHSKGMIHRDIKPANVMINEEGRVLLVDFGLARIMGATQYTPTGALIGTPAYMSPEQGHGKPGDERSDIYALGIMLYEMATRTVPYDADTPFAVIMKHISEPLPIPSAINPDIPDGLEQVIFEALSKDPQHRYQTAGEMALDLRKAMEIESDDEVRNFRLSTISSEKADEIEIDHPTDPITEKERTSAASVLWGDGTATVVSSPRQQVNVLPLALGGGILMVMLLGAAVAGLLLLSNGPTGSTALLFTLVIILVTGAIISVAAIIFILARGRFGGGPQSPTIGDQLEQNITKDVKPYSTDLTPDRKVVGKLPTVFISYSHEDETEKNALLRHLGVLQHAGLIKVWNDDRIGAGADWKQEIEQAMAQANVAILLITANFLTSEFILTNEVPELLRRRQQQGMVVLPIIAKACAWKRIDWLAKLQVKPKNGQPIWSKGMDADSALAVIADEITKLSVR